MRNRFGFNVLALALLSPVALASGGNDTDDVDLDKVHVPALENVSVTANPGHGVTFSAGDDFSLRIYNRIQVQWRFSELDPPPGSNAQPTVQNFRVRRARTKFDGHVFSPDTTFRFYLEWASTGSNMLDAWIQQKLWSNEDWTLTGRAGAGKTQYGKEATGSSGGLEFTERSLATRTFADNRSTGALLTLRGQENKLRINVGLWNSDTAAGNRFGSAPNTNNGDNEINFMFGANYDFQGDAGDLESYKQGDLERSDEWAFSAHGALWIGNERGVGGGTPDVDVLAFNFGGSAKGNGVHVLAEAFFYNAEPDVAGSTDTDANGWNVQGSYALEDGWGVGARVSMVDIDSNNGTALITAASGGTTGGGLSLPVGGGGAINGSVTEFTLGVSKYLNGHARKIQGDITFQNVNPDSGSDSDDIILRIMATLAI